MDDDGGIASVGPSPIQSGTGTNTASVGCTEGGGGRLVGVDNPCFCCCSSCESYLSRHLGRLDRCLLVVIIPWLLVRTAGASETAIYIEDLQ